MATKRSTDMTRLQKLFVARNKDKTRSLGSKPAAAETAMPESAQSTSLRKDMARARVAAIVTPRR
jgi:hypothetical protein